jgi:translation elongation factor EF-Ts
MSAVVKNPSENWKSLKLQRPLNKSAEESINLYRSKFRENIGIESIKVLEVHHSKFQAIGHYIHQKHGLNTGKIGSLVRVESHTDIMSDKLEEIGNSLAKQAVALGDSNLNLTKLLDSDYLFAPIGTVRNFIESLEEKLKTKITALDLAYIKIK